MKIRDGFVTNSSSTSYIIISKNELNGKYLAEKLGVNEDSINYEKILKVCKKMVNDGERGFYHHDYEESITYELVKEIFDEKTAKIFEKAIKKNYNIYCGRISSDEDDYEITMCLDCFKYKDNDIFIDASENVW